MPAYVRLAIRATIATMLLGHVMIDALASDYDGTMTSLMLGGILGTSFALDQAIREPREKRPTRHWWSTKV